MQRSGTAADDTGPSPEETIATVCDVLNGMGIEDVSADSVLAAPPYYDGRALFRGPGSFSRFQGALAVRLRFVGYDFEEVAFLSVRELCEMYRRDSYPPIPATPLSDDQYTVEPRSARPTLAGDPKEFPIAFVLGAPRSGTTLFRAMLDRHPTIWAPGELHLANFETMRDRADAILPVLRYMPIPEAAARCRESIASFSRTFRGWEQRAAPITEVYEALQRADPDVLIVDKSPPYSQQKRYLDRIGEQFPNATFVHLVRSPHDVIRSFVRLQLHRGARRLFESGRNPYQVAEAIWLACNENAETFLKGVPDERKCTLRYEDLVSDPARALGAVCDRLGRAFDPRMANPYASSSSPVAAGAGDLLVHLHDGVESRRPGEPFYPLGRRCQALAERYGY